MPVKNSFQRGQTHFSQHNASLDPGSDKRHGPELSDTNGDVGTRYTLCLIIFGTKKQKHDKLGNEDKVCESEQMFR